MRQARHAAIPGFGGFAATPQGGDAVAQDMTWSDRTAAIFGRMTTHVSDSLRYTIGARYTSEDKEADLYAQAMLGGVVSPTLAGLLQQPGLVGLPRQMVRGDSWTLRGVLQNGDNTFTRAESDTKRSLSGQKDLSEEIKCVLNEKSSFITGQNIIIDGGRTII